MRSGWLAVTLLLPLLLNLPGRGQVREDAGLLLTEIYYDTPGRDEDEEWFELANLGPDTRSLADYKVGDEEQMGHGEGMARFPDDAVIGPGQVIVVARFAPGFRALFGFNPDFEIRDGDPAVPDMERSALWAGGDVALANDGDELLLVGPDNVIRDAVNYGDRTTFFAPAVSLAPTGYSLARVPATCDGDGAADWQALPVPTPGTVVVEGACAPPPDPLAGLELLPIGAIQGRGDRSPYVDRMVDFAGIVTGAYEDRNAAGITYHTLFVQERPGAGDGDPATSDAIAVFLGRRRPRVAPGERVLVGGRVTEFYGFTEIDDAGLSLTALPPEAGAPLLPEPVPLPLPLSASGWEALEAMRVTLPSARVVGPTHTGCGFAVVPAAAAGARPVREQTGEVFPALLSVLHNSDVDCAGFPQVKAGDRVTGLAGPLIYHFDRFRLVQQDPAALSVVSAPLPDFPRARLPASGQMAVATFNLHDYLETDPATGAARRQKLARTIAGALGCPTLLGVQEVQTRTLLDELTDALGGPCGFHYAVAHRESADARGIDVALLADPRRVTVEAVALEQACTPLATGVEDPGADCPAGQASLFSRPPLRVEVMVEGQPYTVFVNHFKSKRGGEEETAPRRLAQARHVWALVDALLARNPAARVMVMGDFNDYPCSPPLDALTAGAGSLENVFLSLPPAERYSYVFDGAAQLLDGVLLSPALRELVAHIEIVHANADYPAGWALDPAIPFHSSDHDVPYLLLDLPTPVAPGPAATAVKATAPAEPVAAPPPAAADAAARPVGVWLAGGGVCFLLLLVAWALLRARAGRR